jgi:hypothetical protein
VSTELKVIRSRRQGVRELNRLENARANERQRVSNLLSLYMAERRQLIDMVRFCLRAVPRWKRWTRLRAEEFLARVDPRTGKREKSSGSNGQAQGGKES